MRGWYWIMAALFWCALGASPAAAQAFDCASVPESICQNEEILALEGERGALVEQVKAADPQSAAAANEQTWLDGLSACGDDAECYRTAYLNHNQTLRQAIPTTPGAATETPLEEPPDASSIEPGAASENAAPSEVREEPRTRGGQMYVASGLPGWGFFTAIGVTLLIFFWLLRARARNRDALRADQAELRDGW